MQPKTLTTIGELRIGDSFVYPRRSDPWRVTARTDKNGKVAVNQFTSHSGIKNPMHKYDELIKSSKQVLFLRHTIPEPGEACLICDLLPGDTFKQNEDDLYQWVLESQGHAFATVRRLDQAAPAKAGIFARVIFIQHK